MLLFILVLAAAPRLSAQVAVSLAIDRQNYLPYENIWASVSIKNQTGHPLTFGSNPKLKGVLDFQILTPDGKAAPLLKGKDATIFGVLPPGGTESYCISLTRLYKVTEPGKYRVRAVLSHSLLSSSYQSNEVVFTIISGMEVWKTEVGIPSMSDKMEGGKKIQTRVYRIINFYDGVDTVFCLLVEDKDFVYGVARIGFDIGDAPPEKEIDRLSKIHILAQDSPTIFTYLIFDPKCKLENKVVYLRADKSRPILVRDPKDGTVVVAGGRLGVKGVDYIDEKGRVKGVKPAPEAFIEGDGQEGQKK